MGLEEAMRVLEIAAPIAEAIPVLGTPVKAALEVTSKILEFAKASAVRDGAHDAHHFDSK
jgi:hypothetical protein